MSRSPACWTVGSADWPRRASTGMRRPGTAAPKTASATPSGPTTACRQGCARWWSSPSRTWPTPGRCAAGAGCCTASGTSSGPPVHSSASVAGYTESPHDKSITDTLNHRALIQTRWRSGSGGRLPLRCPCAAPASCCAAAPIDPTSPGEEPLVPPADHDPDALDVLDTSFRLLVAGPSPLAIDGAALGKGLPARLIPLDRLRALLLDRGTPYAARDAAVRVAAPRPPQRRPGPLQRRQPASAARLDRHAPRRLAAWRCALQL